MNHASSCSNPRAGRGTVRAERGPQASGAGEKGKAPRAKRDEGEAPPDCARTPPNRRRVVRTVPHKLPHT